MRTLYPYLSVYLAIGIAVLMFALVEHRHMKTKQSPINLKDLLEHNPSVNKYWVFFGGKVLAPVLTVLGVVALWPIPVLWKIQDHRREREQREFENYPDFYVQRKDLICTLTVAAVETRAIILDPMNAVPDLPFGHLNQAWCGFLVKKLPGDTLWSFRSNWVNRWKKTELYTGYAWVHEGLPGDYFLTEHHDS